jgi:hypothetical protein
MLSSAVPAAFAGIVREKSAATILCAVNVCEETASSFVPVDLLLITRAQSNEPLEVRAVHVTLAEGVQ